MKSILGNFYRHLATFSLSHWLFTKVVGIPWQLKIFNINIANLRKCIDHKRHLLGNLQLFNFTSQLDRFQFYLFFKKWADPSIFFVYFRSFSNKHQYNFTSNLCEKCQSRILNWDLNLRSSERESPPITTRPGHPPNFIS